MDRFLSFDEMIAPTVIKIVYFLGLAAAVLTAAGTALFSLVNGEFRGFLVGLFMLVFGPLMVRIYAELLILGFRAYEVLCEIRDGSRPV